jgi:hypothetical protein
LISDGEVVMERKGVHRMERGRERRGGCVFRGKGLVVEGEKKCGKNEKEKKRKKIKGDDQRTKKIGFFTWVTDTTS